MAFQRDRVSLSTCAKFLLLWTQQTLGCSLLTENCDHETSVWRHRLITGKVKQKTFRWTFHRKNWNTVFKQSHHTTWTTTTMPIFIHGTLTHICPQKQRDRERGKGKKNTTTTNNRLNCPHQVLDKAHGEKQAGQTTESPCADTSVAPMTDHPEGV